MTLLRGPASAACGQAYGCYPLTSTRVRRTDVHLDFTFRHACWSGIASASGSDQLHPDHAMRLRWPTLVTVRPAPVCAHGSRQPRRAGCPAVPGPRLWPGSRSHHRGAGLQHHAQGRLADPALGRVATSPMCPVIGARTRFGDSVGPAGARRLCRADAPSRWVTRGKLVMRAVRRVFRAVSLEMTGMPLAYLYG